jgi:hypothetical protein
MSIMLSVTPSQLGINLPNAYYRLDSFRSQHAGDTDPKFMVSLRVLGYPQNPTGTTLQHIDAHCYEVPLEDIDAMSAPNFIAGCYMWVMTQEFFNLGKFG